MRKLISDLAEEAPSDNESDLKKILSSYIGFLLFRREIVAFFNMDNESKLVFGQIYIHIGKLAKNLINRPENLGQILKVKQHLDIFYKVLEILNLDCESTLYGKVVE